MSGQRGRGSTPLKMPPLHSVQAERTVLGAAIIDPERVLFDGRGLTPEDFYRAAHGELWRLLVEMSDSGAPIGLAEVAERVHRSGRPDEFGGLSYVTSLSDDIASTHVGHWIHQVKDLSRRRTMWSRLERAQDLVTAGSDMVDVYAAMEDSADAGLSAEPVKCDTLAVEAYRSLIDDIESQRNGHTVSVPLPYPSLAQMLHLPTDEGKAMCIAARPRMGKTALALELARHCAGSTVLGRDRVSRPSRCLFFSMEMGHRELLLRMACQHAKVNADTVKRGLASREVMDRVAEAYEYVHRLNLWIDDTPKHTAGSIKQAITRNIRRYGKLDLVVVDYFGLMKIEPRGGERDDQAKSRAYRDMREHARDSENPYTLVMLSQLNRKCEDRADKRPMLHDLKDTGGLEEHSDVIIFIHRESVYLPETATREQLETGHFLIPKSRGGRPGVLEMGWNGPATSFYERGDS